MPNNSTTSEVALYTSPEAEEHLQWELKAARSLFARENVHEFETLVHGPTKQLGEDTLRKAESWPQAAINWLLLDVFGWSDKPYLFVQKTNEGEQVFGTSHYF